MTKSRPLFRLVFLGILSLALMLAGCAGDSGDSDGALGAGGGGKAALDGMGIVTISDNNGNPVGTGDITAGAISYSLTESVSGNSYPLLFEVDGEGTDDAYLLLPSGNQAFAGILRAYVLESSTNINLTAFTTLHSYLYDRTNAALPASDRYALATTWMNDFFAKMGVDVGANVDFLNDNPYSGANSLAYETAQQFLAFICGEADGGGLREIDDRLKDFADEYVDAIENGENPAEAIAAEAVVNQPVALDGVTTGADLADALTDTDDPFIAAVLESTIETFSVEDVTGVGPGMEPTLEGLKGDISKPAGYDTQVAGITTDLPPFTVLPGLADDMASFAIALTLNDGTVANGDIEVSWTPSADGLLSFEGEDLTNGGTFTSNATFDGDGDIDGGAEVIITYPATPGKYAVTFTSVDNPLVTATVIFETLADDSQTILGVVLLNEDEEDSTAGIAFSGGVENDLGAPTILGDATVATLEEGKLTAILGVAAGDGDIQPEEYIVNFIAPDGVRFVRDSANYPNYAVATLIEGSDVLAEVPAGQMLIKGNPAVGLKPFKVEVSKADGTLVASDSLNNGMYIINDEYKDYVAQIKRLQYNGDTQRNVTEGVSYNIEMGTWTGDIETWASLADLGDSSDSTIIDFYDAPILKLIPGTSVEGDGLFDGVIEDGMDSGNVASTQTAWAMDNGGGVLGTAGLGRAIKAAAGNVLQVYVVIPAAEDNSGGDITSDTPVIFTATDIPE